MVPLIVTILFALGTVAALEWALRLFRANTLQKHLMPFALASSLATLGILLSYVMIVVVAGAFTGPLLILMGLYLLNCWMRAAHSQNHSA